MEWIPIILSLKLALVTTFLLLTIGVPVTYLLTEKKFFGRPILESLISLPLVLPPTVLGFYLLVLLSPNQGLGLWLKTTFDIRLVFSFTGLVIGSVIYSLPFMIQPIQNGINQLPNKLRESGYLLGFNSFKTYTKLLLPNAKRSVFTAIALTFAHTMGEFGVVLMIGGNIPSETRVASIAVFESVESLDYLSAHIYSLILIAVSFSILILINVWSNHSKLNYS